MTEAAPLQEITERELNIRRRLKNDFEHYALKCLRIRNKGGQVRPFVLNDAQRYVHNLLEEQKARTGKVRALILKGRQMGVSTLINGRYFHITTHSRGVQTFILTHSREATENLFKMVKRYYEHCPQLIRPEVDTSNAKELFFGLLDSGYKVGTARNKTVGRSNTIQLLHGSEVAFWENADEHAKGVFQTVPDADGTEIILESTANGVGNFFHQQWQKAEAGQSDYIAIFIPWFWQVEYTKAPEEGFQRTSQEDALAAQYNLTDGQLAWRRLKIDALSSNGADGEKSFRQEYPCCASEAFILTGEDAYIESSIISKARAGKCEKYGPLIIGVDPARFGDDRTSIIRRQGRVAYGLESYTKKDTMEVSGIVAKIIEREQPAKVFVDVGGLGAGVVDRLNELGYRNIISPINAGSSPLDGAKYKNKRAEMWGELKNWLLDEPCQIPNSDSLHADIIGVKYKFDSNSRLQMESKEDMKKRGIRSSDEADALCLTFAVPPSAYEINKSTSSITKQLASNMRSQIAAIKGNYYE